MLLSLANIFLHIHHDPYQKKCCDPLMKHKNVTNDEFHSVDP